MPDLITQPGHLGSELHRNASAVTASIGTPIFCMPVHSFPSFSHLPEVAGTEQAHSFTMPGTWERD